jgi:hypothetical protein
VPSLEQLLRFPSNGLLGLNPCPLGWKLGETPLLPVLPGLGLEFGNCNRNMKGFGVGCYYISHILPYLLGPKVGVRPIFKPPEEPQVILDMHSKEMH